MVPQNNVFPVLCVVCGRSDAGVPIIGQIRSQLQRGVPPSTTSGHTPVKEMIMIMIDHDDDYYCTSEESFLQHQSITLGTDPHIIHF